MKSLLAGVRILDMTRMLAGPYGALILGDLGAEVIKIEPPHEGDLTRSTAFVEVKGENAYFLALNRNKKSVALNLKSKKGIEILRRLVKEVDVVYENFRPGVMEKFNCGYDTLKEMNPGIIFCSVSGFGQDGPYRDRPAFDLNIQAMGGAMSLTGVPGGPPMRMGLPMGDMGGGLFAAIAICAALYNKKATGRGQRIDISLLDCQVSLLTYFAQNYLVDGTVAQPVGSGHFAMVPYQAFPTADGHIVVACATESFWSKFCGVIGREELVDDPRFCNMERRVQNRDELVPIIEEIMRRKPSAHWLAAMDKEGIPSGPVNSVDMVFSDPQVLSRGMVVEMNHPVCGLVRSVGNPIKSTAAEDETFTPSPTLGQHTDEVLMGLLGCSREEIEKLREEGAIQ